MFISMAIGVVFYYAFPAAPPRLMALHGYDLGFVDTVFGGDTAVNYAQPSLILNEYATIPSFHFGWIALASAAIWINTTSCTLRGAAVLLTVVMTWAIVASANHLFIDMVLGGLVIVISWHAARRFARPRYARDSTPVGSRKLAQQTS
ncbi:MAG: phosphatase PAP2 family protein [Tepidiformaceae bacterium]